jgi:branched-subunit amino acid aminotransferase/4-amino-4-deoxychorismate lyase
MSLGVFTTIKVRDFLPLFYEDHMRRLLTQAKALGITPSQFSREEAVEYLQSRYLDNCALRIEFTGEDQLKLTSRPLPAPASEPIPVIIVLDTRSKNKVYKTTDRQVNDQARKQANDLGASDALFAFNGNIIESTICNIFSINSRGQLITPNIAGLGLAGITRQIIIDNAPVIQTHITEDSTSPMVLVNSLRVSRVGQINSNKIDDSAELAQKITALLAAAEKKYK